jgi:hypothetical protein
MLSPVGSLNSDQAVVGLMARHMLHGEFPAFFWGQSYGGSQEAALAAALFGLLGSSVAALKLSVLLLAAIADVLIWRVGRATVGEPGATLAALLFWLWPPGLLWLPAEPGGGHWAALVFGLAGLLVLLRMRDGRADGWAWTALLGVLSGLGLWANPEAAYILLPAGIYLAPRLVHRWRQLAALLLGAALGAAPWLAYNIQHGFASLSVPPQGIIHNSYVDHLHGFFYGLLPVTLGMRHSFTLTWLAPPLGQLGVALALALFVIALVRSRPRIRPVLAVAVAFPFLFAVPTVSWYVNTPRYALALAAVAAILLGALVARRTVWAVGLVIALGVTAVGVHGLVSDAPTAYVPDAPLPANDADLIALARSAGVHDAFADYWIAYRVSFETREQIIVSPTYLVRSIPYADQVRASVAPAYLFVTKASTVSKLVTYCHERGIPVTIHHRGSFTIVQPGARVLPEQVGGWQGQ